MIDQSSITKASPNKNRHFFTDRKGRFESVLNDLRNGLPSEGVETAVIRYAAALSDMPASGGGGCHAALLSAANLGRAAGFSAEEIAGDLADYVHGTRRVHRSEILAAVAKAFSTSPPPQRAAQLQVNAPRLLDAISKRGAGFSEQDLLEASPQKIPVSNMRAGLLMLEALYHPTDLLFLGGREAAELDVIQSVAEWIL